MLRTNIQDTTQQLRIVSSLKNKQISHNAVGKYSQKSKYLDKIVEGFEKNRKQIEEQTS